MSEKIDQYKPKAKTLDVITSLRLVGDAVCQAKADGEFTLLHFDRRGESYTINRWGTRRTSFPALFEFTDALNQQRIGTCRVLGELYAVRGERMLVLPQLIHHLKGDGGDLSAVHIGVWDVASIDGQPPDPSYRRRLQAAEAWFRGCQRVGVLPYIVPTSHADVEAFWDEWVVGRGYEGLMLRVDHDLWKLKPKQSVDMLIEA